MLPTSCYLTYSKNLFYFSAGGYQTKQKRRKTTQKKHDTGQTVFLVMDLETTSLGKYIIVVLAGLHYFINKHVLLQYLCDQQGS